MEAWLAGKGKPVQETNISNWRRTVCGDLTTVFRRYNGEAMELPKPLVRNEVIEGINRARYKSAAKPGEPLAKDQINVATLAQAQEPGTRPSCPLPYELSVNAVKTAKSLEVTMEARNRRFGKKSAGSPFNAYTYQPKFQARGYAVEPGKSLTDTFAVEDSYNVRIDGPNGFMRHFQASGTHPDVQVSTDESGLQVQIKVENRTDSPHQITLTDESYGAPTQNKALPANGTAYLTVDAKPNSGWYDFTITIGRLQYRYAGRIETGNWSITDPAMA